MEVVNGNAPKENNPINVASLADGLIGHIIQIMRGDVCAAASVANLIKLRIDAKYNFLVTRNIAASYATTFEGQHEPHLPPQ
jgi:hypothetical protein